MRRKTLFRNNPIIYHVMTDRFCRGSLNGQSPSLLSLMSESIGDFHGGNFRGITTKIKDGWFSNLGVNGIWLTAPYEQIRGWVPGAGNKFKHWPYHGYWALDYTMPEPRFGTGKEFKELVDAAHSANIKIILDVAVSHPGYPDLCTLSELAPCAIYPGWEDATADNYNYYFRRHTNAFADWWGAEWINASLPGYSPDSDNCLTDARHNLPKFRTDSISTVSLPPFFKKKETMAHERANTTVRGYLVEWLCEWIRQYGIDGFRCDSAKHVDLETWADLKEAAGHAYTYWRNRNMCAGQVDDRFWMTGEVFGHGIEMSHYFKFGFDNLINFSFQNEVATIFRHYDATDLYLKSLALRRLDQLFTNYSDRLAKSPDNNILSYISSHDTYLFPREHMLDAGTALLLAPGGIQIFYGDETRRPAGPYVLEDPSQATRSNMNWETVDRGVLTHWCKLGSFRARHPAIAAGQHRLLSVEPYVFVRYDDETDDRVIVMIGSRGTQNIEAGAWFGDGELLCDAYTGRQTIIRGGRCELIADDVVLLELKENNWKS